MTHGAGIGKTVVQGLVALASLAPGLAFAQEISLPDAYNRLYHTQYSPYDLPGLTRERAGEMPASFTTRELRTLQVVAFETSGAGVIAMELEHETIVLFDPGPWTPPSRGWMVHGQSAPQDLAAVLRAHGYNPDTTHFRLSNGGEPLTPLNTVRLNGAGNEFLLGYNDGGLTNADGDANEPILRCTRSGVQAQAPAQNPVRIVAPPAVQPYQPLIVPSTQTEAPITVIYIVDGSAPLMVPAGTWVWPNAVYSTQVVAPGATGVQVPQHQYYYGASVPATTIWVR